MEHICYLPKAKTESLPEVGPQLPQAGSVHFRGHSVSDATTRTKLHQLAAQLGRDIIVTSGDRSRADQDRLRRQGLNPARNSQHLQGKAADIWVEGMTQEELGRQAKAVGFTGIGIYRNHVHVDTRPEPVLWHSSGR